MDIRQLQYFLSISSHGSMNKAADSLFITQSALSQAMSRLEKELGLELFHRSRDNSLELTPAGIHFRVYCREALDLWAKTSRELNRIKEQRDKHYIVGSSSVYLQSWLPFVEKMSAEGAFIPDFIFDSADNLKEKLLNNEIHMILGAYDRELPSLRYMKAQERELPLCVARSHPLARYSFHWPGQEKLRVKISEAAPYDFVLLDPSTVIRHLTDAYFREQSFRPVSYTQVRRSDEALFKLVTGQSVGFVSRPVETDSMVLPIALDPPIIYRTGAIWRSDFDLPPVLQRIAEHYRDSYRPSMP